MTVDRGVPGDLKPHMLGRKWLFINRIQSVYFWRWPAVSKTQDILSASYDVFDPAASISTWSLEVGSQDSLYQGGNNLHAELRTRTMKNYNMQMVV